MITHILSDGRQVKDIVGKVIKVSEHKAVYEVINSINEGRMNDESIISAIQLTDCRK